MTRRQLLKICSFILFGLVVFGLTNDRGSANGDPEERRLEAFIEAAAAVDGVMATWQAKIIRADGDKADLLRHQANDAIRESIEQVEGISFAEYRELRRAIAVDPAMLARVTDMMRRQQQD